MNLDDQNGFNAAWDDVVTTFRKVAIDDPMDGGNLDVLNSHAQGPIDANGLANQMAYPFVMSVPMNWDPDFATTASDQGTLNIQVVAFAADAELEIAFEKARILGGRIVNNVEANQSLVDPETGRARGDAFLTDFQMDFTPSGGPNNRQQVKFCNLQFGIEAKRHY